VSVTPLGDGRIAAFDARATRVSILDADGLRVRGSVRL
jgi:hypothetical protein